MADDVPITSPSQLDVPVTSPDQVDPSLAPQPQPSPANGSPEIQMPDDFVGRPLASASTQGLPGGQKRTGELFHDAHITAAQDEAPFNAEYNKESADVTKNYGDLANATQDEGAITKAHYGRETEILQREDQFYQNQAKLEQAAYDNAKVDQAKYISSYQEQLAGVRQLMQQSGDPLGNLTFGQKAGLGFASFAQGFLAARGINIDVTGQVDRWVNRSIAEHQQQIQNARESAGDTLHLYEIARQTSQDDYEARQRMRGFVIEGLKTSIQANAARFNSDIANAHANEAVAKLNIEAANTQSTIAERRMQMVHSFDQMRIQEAEGKGELEIKRAKFAWEKAKADKEKPTKPSGILKIPDPGATIRDQTIDPKTGKPSGKVIGTKNMWAIDPNATPQEQDAAQKIANESGNTYATVRGETEKLRKLRAPAMESYTARYAPAFAKKMFDEDYRVYQTAKTEAIIDARHAMAGANLTENEAKEWNSILEDDSGWQSGGNAKKLELFEKHYRDRFVHTMNQTTGIVPLAEGDQDARAYNDASNDTDANYDARMNKNLPETKVVAKETGEAAQDRPTPGSVADYIGGVEDVHKEAWAEHMRNVAEAAIDPSRLIKEYKSNEDAEKVKADARQSLVSLAQDESITSTRRAYAKWLLERLDKDPEELATDLANPNSFDTPTEFRGGFGHLLRHEDK